MRQINVKGVIVGRIENNVGAADVVDVSDIMELMPIRAAVQAGVGAVPANILNLMGTRKCGKNKRLLRVA
jgi:hypothetical protein